MRANFDKSKTAPKINLECEYCGEEFTNEKSRIRETKHLSTDADSSTDTTVGWTKNSRKPNFFEKRKKSSKTQKLKTA